MRRVPGSEQRVRRGRTGVCTRRRFLRLLAGATAAGGAASVLLASLPPTRALGHAAGAASIAHPAVIVDDGMQRRAPALLGQSDPVRFGGLSVVAEAGQMIAEERGYFRDEGLEVAYTEFEGGNQAISLLATDQLDVYPTTMSAALFNAVARDVPIRIVGPLARHDRGASASYLMVRHDLAASGAIQDYGDLRAKRIAVAATDGGNDYALAQALATAGLVLEDVELVVMPFPDMIAALASASIDAALQAEPAATVSAGRGVAVKWRELGELAGSIQFSVVLYAPKFHASRPDEARRWMTAYLRGVREYHEAFVRKATDPSELISMLARRTTAKDPALYDKMGYAYVDPNGRINVDSLGDMLAWLRAQGKVAASIDLGQVVDLSFADYAVERLGIHPTA